MISAGSLRLMKKESKKTSIGIKRVIKMMEGSLNSSSEYQIQIAAAFFQILKYHIEDGDLEPKNIILTKLLREEIQE